MLKRLAGVFALFFLLLAMTPPQARSQEVAAITGVVTDASGGTVSDARVTLVDTRTGAKFDARTISDGTYRIPKVSPGPGYTLTITRDGFETITITNLYLAVATTTTQNVQLQVGAVSQKVEVKSEGSVALNTTDTTIGNNFDKRAIESLPNEFRGNPANLLALQPAVVSADINNTFDDNGLSRNGAVAGARADQDNITVDGIDASDFGIGQSFTQVAPIPIDALQEFRTEVANPLPESGRGSGAQTIITTKSGTNNWHGSAREYHRNTITEANDFFNNKAGISRPTLIRNQFGGNIGGPIKKDKLFFFFDYDGRRDASQTPVTAIVPLDHVRNGQIAYINNSSPACTPASTMTSTPSCVTILSPLQVAALDPCSQPNPPGPCAGVTPGFDPALLSLFNSRYPRANTFSVGDGVNTGGYQFNAPSPDTVNTYTARADYNIATNQKLFVRFNFYNQHAIAPGLPSIQFPGDPITNPQISYQRSWAIGETWTINTNTLNQFVYGEARADLTTVTAFNPNANVYQLNWLFGTGISNPYARQGGTTGTNPVPTFRDDVTFIRGKHTLQFGGVFKPIRTRSRLINNLEFENEGIGASNLPSLDPSLRPADILQDPNGIVTSNWDNFFSNFLGLEPFQFDGYDYLKNGTLIPSGAGDRRDYRYFEYEAYGQDSWKLRSDLTFTYGLRYSYDSVPYETNGLQASSNVSFGQELSTRVANGLAGISGFDSAPLLTYVLSGKGNHDAPSLYNGDKLNFSPRLGLSWNPSFRNGVLGSILGDRKTVLRAGFAKIFDHTALSAVNFVEDQASFLFSGAGATQFTGNTPEELLATAPRFTSVSATIAPPVIPPFTTTVTPFTAGSGANLVVFGTEGGNFGNYVIDPNYKTPYALTYTAGLQRELPKNFQLEIDYVGRFGRRLSALADSGQLVNFVDPASKQTLVGAITTLEQEQRQGVPVQNIQPLAFFENQIALATGESCAALAPQLGPFSNCTQFVYANNGTALQQGNILNIVKGLLEEQALPPGVGLSPQFISNYYFGNKAWSSYNGMLVILRKRFSQNLQMDFNYTFSHSLDNSSAIARGTGNPFFNAQSILCDSANLGTCRGNSEFDLTHQITSTFIYDLPIGHGQHFARSANRALNEVIGGWQVSGIVTWRTGFAFPVTANASSTTFGATAYPIFNGDNSAIATHVHTNPSDGSIQLFANPTAALGAFSDVTGLETGSRDILRGPHFANVDLALVKSFPLVGDRIKLQFRTEAYNAFNHPNFGLPISANVDAPQFGQITTTAGNETARVLQFALRLDF